MLQIKIATTPSQVVRAVLGDQQLQMLIYQKKQGLFVDIAINGVDVVAAVVAQNENPLVCRKYMGFKGNLFFIDTEGKNDPYYTGLDSRYNLIWLDGAEYELVRK